MTVPYYAAAALAALLLALVIAARIAPQRTIRMVIAPLLRCLYRRRVVGLENFPRTGGAVVVCNHTSWLDGILLLWMLPRSIRFIVDGGNFNNALLNWMSRAFGTILMRPSPKSIAAALRTGREALHNGEIVGIFPEGTITRSGQLQGFRPGLRKLLQGTDAVVVPCFLQGMWGSVFSFSGGRFFWKRPSMPRRRLTLYVGRPLPAGSPVAEARQRVQALGAEAVRDHKQADPVLVRRMLRSLRRRGGRLKAADSTGVETSGRELLVRTLALRRTLRREVLSDDERMVGVLLPPSVPAVATNFALALDHRVAVNLNYTVTSDTLNYCIAAAGIRHVLTSQKFLDKFNFKLDAEIVLLEEVRERVSRADKLAGLLGAVLPVALVERQLGLQRMRPDDLLTVIFTSGSTGAPKGVMLSQANIGHNVDAIGQVVRLTEEDVVLGILPFFHSFGYAVTLWGVMTLNPAGVYHFNPLDAKQVGKLAERHGATVLLATPTFLRGYLRRVEPAQFAALDTVVVGAEKMPIALAESFEQRFGVRPVEGYGTTELSPLVSVNVPPSRSAAKHQADRREGSVGRPMPGVAARVVSIEDRRELGPGEEGMLMIAGANVMRGYLGRDDLTAEVVRDGWYETGDMARIDEDGFIHITGRQSRFSKIGGEMVPHLHIEEVLARLLAEGEEDDVTRVAVTAVPDEKKGERLIVLHLPTKHSVDEMRQALSAAGLPNIFIPGESGFIEVDEIPMLGTGKLDLKRVRELALELTAGK